MKRLVSYYYFNHIDAEFGCREDFAFLKSSPEAHDVWGNINENLEKLKSSISGLGLQSKIYGEIQGIIVPLAIPKLNAAVFYKNKWVTTFDETTLRGEFQLLVRILNKKGVKTHFCDIDSTSEEKFLENISQTLFK